MDIVNEAVKESSSCETPPADEGQPLGEARSHWEMLKAKKKAAVERIGGSEALQKMKDMVLLPNAAHLSFSSLSSPECSVELLGGQLPAPPRVGGAGRGSFRWPLETSSREGDLHLASESPVPSEGFGAVAHKQRAAGALWFSLTPNGSRLCRRRLQRKKGGQDWLSSGPRGSP